MKQLILLSQQDFKMPLLQDLGIVNKRRKGIFQCLNCYNPFITNTTVAKNSITGVCKNCNNISRPKRKSLKPLPSSINGLTVIKCTGIKGTSQKRHAIFNCPYCENQFEAVISNVKAKTTTKCHSCGLIQGPRPGFKNHKQSLFYVLKFHNSDKIKIGITNTTVEKRYQKKEQKTFTVQKLIMFTNGIDAFKYEQYLLLKYNMLRFKDKEKLLISGNREILEKEIFTHKLERTIHESISSWGKCTGQYIECSM